MMMQITVRDKIEQNLPNSNGFLFAQMIYFNYKS